MKMGKEAQINSDAAETVKTTEILLVVNMRLQKLHCLLVCYIPK